MGFEGNAIDLFGSGVVVIELASTAKPWLDGGYRVDMGDCTVFEPTLTYATARGVFDGARTKAGDCTILDPTQYLATGSKHKPYDGWNYTKASDANEVRISSRPPQANDDAIELVVGPPLEQKQAPAVTNMGVFMQLLPYRTDFNSGTVQKLKGSKIAGGGDGTNTTLLRSLLP